MSGWFRETPESLAMLEEERELLAYSESRCWYDDQCVLDLGHEGGHRSIAAPPKP